MTDRRRWIQARRQLRSGMEIRAWSHDKGFTGKTFLIDDNSARAISVTSPTISKPRPISEANFLKLTALWDAYVAGDVERAELTDLSQNTTYIFGMLKWRDDNPE